MSEHDADQNILRDLLADQATQGLSAEEQELLARLQTGDLEDAEELELTAAAIQMADLMADEPMPETLQQKVKDQAKDFFKQKQEARKAAVFPAETRAFPAWRMWTGWALAAALLLAIFVQDYRASAPFASAAKLRQELLARPGTVRLAWSATEDAAAKGLTGDVIWNEQDQRGYMTFRGLAKNDPLLSTYQLWIFAGNQDERFPADGGIFDAGASGAEIIIPIAPRVRVQGATLFVVTVERPGGVVVSKRERVVSAAKL